MRAVHHIESHEHARRAEREEDRAMHQLERGHVGRAAHLEHKSNEQKFMAVETSNHPVAMATALHPGAAVGAAVVASEVREAEMIAAAQHHHHHPGMVVVQEPVYYPGPPVAGYPPAGYPPYGYPR